MEIPTDKIIEEIERDGEQDEVLKIIKAQALEIRELQAVIVRLRDEIRAMDEAQPVDFWAKRRMEAFRALPEPRIPWEQFKRTWKDS